MEIDADSVPEFVKRRVNLPLITADIPYEDIDGEAMVRFDDVRRCVSTMIETAAKLGAVFDRSEEWQTIWNIDEFLNENKYAWPIFANNVDIGLETMVDKETGLTRFVGVCKVNGEWSVETYTWRDLLREGDTLPPDSLGQPIDIGDCRVSMEVPGLSKMDDDDGPE